MIGMELFFKSGLAAFSLSHMRDLSDALVVSIPQRPRIPHQAKEPFSELMDAICLTEVQSLLGKDSPPPGQ